MTTRPPVGYAEPILIVGAGVFGLSTALELKKRGFQDVTVLDRYLPPVVDGSSVDISRVIRVEYADPLYGRMAREALDGWQGEYAETYHQSGFVMLADKVEGHSYLSKTQQVDESLGSSLEVFEEASDVAKRYSGIQAHLGGLTAFSNPGGGWADAEASIRRLSQLCTTAGVSFVTGTRGRVLGLDIRDGTVVGVKVADGSRIPASQVILATGAWTNRLVAVSHATSASGQPVGFIKLTPEEARSLEGSPVIINLSTGIFCFPPTQGTNILKIARHSYGFATTVPTDDGAGSAPRLVSSPKRDGDNTAASYLPEDAEFALREGLRQLLPQFANHEWMSQRLCWYSDTPEGDFIIDHHPDLKGLFVAGGGAGHAFKFLPVLGRYIADCYENKADMDVRQKWRLRPGLGSEGLVMKGDGSRGGPPLRTLDAHEQAKL
ncbi:FAD dependent oxidoreductase [Microdochium bolleyi]|uniref:FAD dependent oxidoreductase n=1 Tax=Microdochium bolleyi TaxID=196109 RepID=A0A136J338_9PEZI|nr:FAD dependent oxidoreductase [Microdochium bolleyi]